MANLLKALEAGIFNDTTAERMRVLEDTRSRLEDALPTEQNRQKFDIKLEDVIKLIDEIADDLDDPTTLDRILDAYIERIIVTEDKIVIVMRYTDERREEC